MKEEKIGITPINWILSILGIAVLLCFIILPPVFRVVFKEEVKVPDDEPIIEHLTCTKNNYVTTDHFENDSITFNYVGNKVNTYSRVTEMTFHNLDDYEKVRDELGRLATAYSLLDGVEYIVTPDVGSLKITLTQKFNLGTFKSTSVTVPGDLEPTQLTSDYTHSQLIKDIKADLIDEKYSCK